MITILFSSHTRASTSLSNSARRWRSQAFAHCFKDLIKLSVHGCIQYTTIINGAFFITIEMTFVFVHVFLVNAAGSQFVRGRPHLFLPYCTLFAVWGPKDT